MLNPSPIWHLILGLRGITMSQLATSRKGKRSSHIDDPCTDSPHHMQLCVLTGSRRSVLFVGRDPRWRFLSRSHKHNITLRLIWMIYLGPLSRWRFHIIFELHEYGKWDVIYREIDVRRERSRKKCAPPRCICPSWASIILSLTRKERKYCPRDREVMAPSTLKAPTKLTPYRQWLRPTWHPYRIFLLGSYSPPKTRIFPGLSPLCSWSRRRLCPNSPWNLKSDGV